MSLMELVYLYIHKSELYQSEQHINLDPLYTYRLCKSDKGFKIEKKRTDLHFNVMRVNDIISNMTLLVGRNGVGKSNFFRLLIEIFQDEPVNFYEEAYVLFRESEGYYWLYTRKPKEPQRMYQLKMKRDKLEVEYELPASNKAVQLRVYEIPPEAQKSIQKNFTYNAIACNVYNEKSSSFYRMIKYLQKQLENDNREMFKFPPYCAEIQYSRYWLYQLASNLERDAIDEEQHLLFDFKVKESILIPVLGGKQINETEYIRFKFLNNVVDWYEVDAFHAFIAEYFGLIYRNRDGTIDEMKYYQVLKKQLIKYETPDEKPKDLKEVINILWKIADVFREGQDLRKSNERYIEDYHQCLECLLKPYQTIKDIELDSEKGRFSIDISQPIEDTVQSLIKYIAPTAECENYTMLSDFVSYSIQFLSEGEKSYLHYFSVLNELLDETILDSENGKYDVLLLLDEPDHRMHPELSRQFVKLLTDFIKNHSNHNIRNIQLMLTTHSPFIVTDFPKEHVLFFNREEDGTRINNRKHETFGANIHHLLIDDFFMDQTIGEFARLQLEKVLECLQQDCTAYDSLELQQIIASVGDDIVRQQLQAMYNRCFAKVEDVRREIERLERRLRELEGESQ